MILSANHSRQEPGRAGSGRFIGIDAGTETIKVIELVRQDDGLRCVRRHWFEHGKNPGPMLIEALRDFDWPSVQGAAVSGRFSRLVNLPHIPVKQAQGRGHRFWFGNRAATLVSIGNHGFSVLELRENGLEVFRENSRCSQGTGNFLRQLVERFSLGIGEASALAATVEKAAPLSGRCPVILKTDMTHQANKGENRAQILAGLFDAVCENVLVLIKPGLSPARVVLIGGVSRSMRVQRTMRQALAERGMELEELAWDDGLFFEALGDAVLAAEQPSAVPPLEGLLAAPRVVTFDRVAPLAQSLSLVRRLSVPAPTERNGDPLEVILGFDIGSTGSKLVALEAATGASRWEGYRRTGGDPVGAAQALLEQYLERTPSQYRIRAFGVTGSGREIVGSLLTTCYGENAVFVLNEIAAHAEGAMRFDPRVDTIFEIGGQDAKYIRLAGGRVIDCAMNEACSAGTGSFIEEQGRKFPGIEDVAQLGQRALAATSGVSLGQHCSVFMAEIIEDSVAAGVATESILAGLYDSIVQNYLNRVKGNRSVGQVIFCQGMPFSADALAAAVARRTGSQVIVPPNPGTVGALGIALLAARELPWQPALPLCAARFLGARIEQKETFICKATVGCGGSGNKCRIDAIKTVVQGQQQRFSWGGACSLYDKGTRKTKLPDRSPDPFREREELVRQLLGGLAPRPGAETVALTDEFALKGLIPFFAVFLDRLGFKLLVASGGGRADLKRGVQGASVPFCAPMQLYHGVVSRLACERNQWLFLPMLREIPRLSTEPTAAVCPIIQASPHLLRWDLKQERNGRVIAPVIDLGPGRLDSGQFLASCQRVAEALGRGAMDWRAAHRAARSAQLRFEAACEDIGRRALAFCAQHHLAAVVVLGRAYTIYSTVLNSNVPMLLREQGALAIPVDCYPVETETPLFPNIYWGFAHRILRAAHQIRRASGVYSLYCSNYSCGPDSFNLHFYSHIMEGKPYAVIETDGHAGDAGTKTRVEAFLHCVAEDRKSRAQVEANDFARVPTPVSGLGSIWPEERLLIPWLGSSSDVVAACLRGVGL